MVKTVDSVISEIDEILKRSATHCTQVLAPFVSKRPLPDQIFACFEIFHMQNYALCYNSFFARNQKLETDYSSISPTFESFIPDLNTYIGQHAGQMGWGDKEGMEFTQRHEDQLQKWFAACWEKVEGRKSIIPTYFCFEKEYMVRDLFTNDVMEEIACAAKLGHPGLEI